MDASASAALMTNGQAHQQDSSSSHHQNNSIIINNREMNDLASDCNQWGRYNVHYLEPDGERMTSGSGNSLNCVVGSAPPSSPCPGDNNKRHHPLRSSSKVSSTTNEAQGGNGTTTRSIKRHGSDAGTRNKGTKNRNRVSRRPSEGPNGSAAAARSKMQQPQSGQQQHSGSSGGHSGGIIRLGSSTSCLEPCLRLSIIHRHESDLRKKRVAFSDAPVVVWNDPPVILFSPSPSSRQSITNNSGLASYHRRHSYPSNSLLADGDSGGFKDSAAGGGGDEFQHQQGAGGDEVLTPKERRRRKVVMAVVCTTFILLTASALFVLITLFNASAIDEAGITFHLLRILYWLESIYISSWRV